MYTIELIVFLGSGFFMVKFLIEWYRPLIRMWPPGRGGLQKVVLQVLPPAALGMILFTLRVLASFDVIGDFFYLLLYVLLGMAWIYFGLWLMTRLFDLSWLDDAIYRDNKAAMVTVCGGFLAITLIYAGANIGDGPGWWCVIFAGGLGLLGWILLARLIDDIGGRVFERITVGRDRGCGIRMGGYLLGSGIVLARASAGDWTSFSATVVEFAAGWPVLILAAACLVVEWLAGRPRRTDGPGGGAVAGSVCIGVLYIALGVVCVLLLPPLVENPFYDVLWAVVL